MPDTSNSDTIPADATRNSATRPHTRFAPISRTGSSQHELATNEPVRKTRGTPIAVRTLIGLVWSGSDHHGTEQVQINADDLTTNRRRHLPYGEDRSATQPTFSGTRGFVGGTQDDTGLTHLGAREYDPTLGRFISIDPIMDLANPQQMHGYAYSNNSPVTYSDPSGLYFEEGSHGDGQRGFVTETFSGKSKVRVSGKPLGLSTRPEQPAGGTSKLVPNPVPPLLRPLGAPDLVEPWAPAHQPAVQPAPPAGQTTQSTPKKSCKAWSWLCSTGQFLLDNRGAILNGAAVVAMGACIVATAGACGAVAIGAAAVSIGYRGYDFVQSERTAADLGKLGIGVVTDVALTRIPTARVRVPGRSKKYWGDWDIPLGRVGQKLTGATKLHLSPGRMEQAYPVSPYRATGVIAGWSIGTNHDPATSAYSYLVER
ncbi:RHS repeat-associated core domain-containing protein [Micromonospora tarapacensis]|uniref:RHS repeat-associated core domain-containing protein n=1 Tax=Micromonospora tarapacensis TaxID=2835305 RepID=UPI0038B2DAFE